ncbi:MAG TPA: molybdopterin cofactor-binding domain-containing protein [Gemmatimonadales bacterium]|nr:molybdopterin cofactor-binding domain-containing protein [Gemmatimonadales bacterium]
MAQAASQPTGDGSNPEVSRTVSRRSFLVMAAAVTAGGSGLMWWSPWVPGDRKSFAPDFWIRIHADGRIHLTIHKCEMGQGVLTALAMLIAEELEVEWSRVRVTQADADFRFADQNTSGSSSIIDSWTRLREAGAVARAMLVRAAAARWRVPEIECDATGGVVSHRPTGRRIGYGELAALAAAVPAPEPGAVRLKPPEAFRLIGRRVRRLDAPDKITGRQVYGMDLRLPGMLYASVVRCPILGGTVRGLDDTKARSIPGVRDVVRLEADAPSRLPERVAVIADSTWAALQGRQALGIEWDKGPNASLSSEAIERQLADLDDAEPVVLRNDGDALALVRKAGALHATYQVPYLAHAAMEPINCTAHARGGVIEIWAPTQFPQRAVEHVARFTGLPRERVRLHVIPMGGGFGRRVYPDFVVEAVQVARAARAPVKTVWTREDDIRNDFYRPVGRLRLSAALDRKGRPSAWVHRLTGPSILRQVRGAAASPEESELYPEVVLYSVPSVRVEYREAAIPVPLGVWRSVAQSQNVFAVESFIDELAHQAKADPVRYRRDLLSSHPRLQHVLDVAARAAGWGAPLPAGHGRGVAVSTYGEPTSLALIAELSVETRGRIKIGRLTCAVDCGQIVNPLSLEAQIEGGLVWGLSAALWGEITVKHGGIEQSNFHDYRVARISDMPRIDIHIVPSTAPPGGIGEPSVPLVAPAVANALFAATGVRHRQLPLEPQRAG